MRQEIQQFMLEKAGEISAVILSKLKFLMRVLVNGLSQERNWHTFVNVSSLKLLTAFVCIMSNVPLKVGTYLQCY
jgi:hypothetical protein